MASPQPPHVTAFALHDYAPKIVPAQAGRDWMDAFPAGQAYRCRPMLLANALGWNVLAPVPLDISWNGGAARDDLQITSPLPLPGGGPISYLCESHFSAGIFTLHVDHIFRTHPPGWNLLVTAPFNTSRENAVALAAIIDSEALAYPFTMNWQMLRPGTTRFEQDEPFCTVVPVPVEAIAAGDLQVRSVAEDPELQAQYTAMRAERERNG